MVLEKREVLGILISEMSGQEIEEASTMDSKRPLSCLLYHGWGILRDRIRNSQPSSPIIPLPVYSITFYQALTQFPQETYLVSFAAPLLRINSHFCQLLSIVQTIQTGTPYL